MLDDLTSFLSSVLDSAPRAPVFLMGHSMGGAEVLVYASVGPAPLRARIRGYLAEAPFVALHPDSRPSRLTVVLGRLAAKVLPQRQMLQHLDARWLSRDESVRKDWVDDPLCHDVGTLEGLAGMLGRAEELESGKVKVADQAARVWVGHGSEDRVTSFEASRRWLDGLEGVRDREFRVYEGWFHKRVSSPSLVFPDRRCYFCRTS